MKNKTEDNRNGKKNRIETRHPCRTGKSRD